MQLLRFFFVLNCIFFGFRAFYPLFIQFFAVILHRNSKPPHAHHTFIAFPSHTRARVINKRTWYFLQMEAEF